MSGSSGSGASGIVQNSALAFVASAQAVNPDLPTNPATLPGPTSDQVNQTGNFTITYSLLCLRFNFFDILLLF